MIILMRHGEDDPDRLGGWSRAGLTDRGKEQARASAEALVRAYPGIRRIVSSDLPRARETAEIVAERFGLPVELDPAFRETNNGALAGMLKSEAQEKYPGLRFAALGFDECYPGGESPRQFAERIRAAWTRFKADVTEDTLLVTHAGVISVIRCTEDGVAFTNKAMAYYTEQAGFRVIE
ncbi:MAG: histidine phosphatase family protein [Clostridia bacterium]|nr:histidine phosphatase family protein [Clostridia bacterium]